MNFKMLQDKSDRMGMVTFYLPRLTISGRFRKDFDNKKGLSSEDSSCNIYLLQRLFAKFLKIKFFSR